MAKAGTDGSHRRCGPGARSAATAFHFKVNDERVAIPYNPSKHLRVVLRAQRLLLVTDFEMEVDFDGKHSAGNRQGTNCRGSLCQRGGLALKAQPSATEAGGSSLLARPHGLSQRNPIKPKPKRKKRQSRVFWSTCNLSS